MSDHKHTPGEWRYISRTRSIIAPMDPADADGPTSTWRDIAKVERTWPANITDAEADANGRVMAAAPALRDALRFARRAIRSGEMWTEECERIIDGALALADGQEEA